MKIRFSFQFVGVILVFSLLFMYSCRLSFDEVDTVNYLTPEIAVPIVENITTMNEMLKDIVGSGFVEIQNDGSYVIKYSTNFTTPSTLNLFANTTETLRIPIASTQTTIPFPTPMGTRIDEITLKSGSLNWFMRSAPKDTLIVRLTVSEITKNGVALDTTFTVDEIGNPIAFNLNGWTVKPTNGNINITYSAQNKANLPAFVDATQSFYQISKFDYSLLKGYIGQHTVSIPEQFLALDFFNKWSKQGEIKFASPRIRLTLENSMGAPVTLKSSIAQAISLKGDTIQLDSDLKNGIELLYPNMSEIGKSRQTPFIIDKSNSNIVDILNANPSKIRLKTEAFINPDAMNTQVGFLTDKSQILSRLDVELPLHLSAKDFVYYDTLNVDFTKFKDIIEGEFKVITINGMPIDVNMQGYFVDGNNTVVDSLIQKSTLLVQSATLNANGTKAADHTAYNYVYVTSKQFNAIKTTKRLIVKYTLGTYNGGTTPVRIYSSDRIELKLGFKGKINL